ncbi:MAG TPA: ArsA-related P-loop ATPase [Microlunatus sp.]|nr:ArsA-related P-loop ATPase [Microlunatus sp.]
MTTTASAQPEVLDVDALIADLRVRIAVICGAGGVGKTTSAAALALRAAEAGRKVVVLTIDPARRLAQSLGVADLDNTPRPVQGIDPTNGGSLDAMMLDMKRTFDEVVLAHSTADSAASILENPFYVALSSQFAGTQEYMAMEKLGQLHTEAVESGAWDLIVVDTPPARSALDFLDAPEHLSSLLDGRFLKVLLAGARGPFRLVSVGFNLVAGALNKILGGGLLTDLQTFIAAFEAIFGGFRERATQTFQLLASPQTTFLVVATPQRDALREAAYFVDRLSDEGMPLAGVVVNRVNRTSLDVSAERALALAEDLDPTTSAIEIAALRQHADLVRVIENEQLLLDRFSAHRTTVPRTSVTALPSDVTDIGSLRRVGALLADRD